MSDQCKYKYTGSTKEKINSQNSACNFKLWSSCVISFGKNQCIYGPWLILAVEAWKWLWTFCWVKLDMLIRGCCSTPTSQGYVAGAHIFYSKKHKCDFVHTYVWTKSTREILLLCKSHGAIFIHFSVRINRVEKCLPSRRWGKLKRVQNKWVWLEGMQPL